MKKETIVRGNEEFFLLAVGMCLGMRAFAGEVLECSMEEFAQFPTDHCGPSGYIRVYYTAIKEMGRDHQDVFEQQVQAGLFTKLTHGFHSGIRLEGDLHEKTTIKKDGYEFLFHIVEYERDSDHGFEFVKPEDLGNIPEEEKLGRMVHITIKIEEK